jgi:plasmid replication initiation protein
MKELRVQTNIISLSKSSLSVPERRILYVIIDTISPYLFDKIGLLNGKEIDYKKGAFDMSKICYKASDICRADDYGELRAALESLKNKAVCFETDKMYYGSSLILKYKFEKGSEILELGIDEELYKMLLDIKNGYTLFQVKVALSLSSVYAMKIYELLAKWRNRTEFYISLEEIRHITDSISIYQNIADFTKRVIDVAKKQLDDSNITDLRFTYSYKKWGRKVVGFNINIIKTDNSHEFENKTKEHKISVRGVLGKDIRDFLEQNGVDFNFKGTLEIFEKWLKIETKDPLEILENLKISALKSGKREKNDIGGYISGTIRKMVK